MEFEFISNKDARKRLDEILKCIRKDFGYGCKINYTFVDTTKYNLTTKSELLSSSITIDLELHILFGHKYDLRSDEVIRRFVARFAKFANYDGDIYTKDGKYILLKYADKEGNSYTANIEICDCMCDEIFGYSKSSDKTICEEYEDSILESYAEGCFIEDIDYRPLEYKVYDLKRLGEWDNFKAEYLAFKNKNPFINQRDAFNAALNRYYKDHHTNLGYPYDY